MLDATLEIAEDGGLAAVSMRSVAARLGVTPMTLYRHVRDKQDLLDGLVERLLGELPVPDSGLPWEDRFRSLSNGLRETAARHPDVFPMLFRRPVSTPDAARRREAVYALLRDAGVPDELVPRAERLLSTFMIGFAVSEASGRFAAHDPAVLEDDLNWAAAQGIALLQMMRSEAER